MAVNQLRNFECGVCAEDKSAWVHYHIGACVCLDCVKESIIPMFQEALLHEYAFPPVFGQYRLNHKTFLNLFPTGFVQKYEQKIKEYQTPVKQRIWCQHTVLKPSVFENLGFRSRGEVTTQERAHFLSKDGETERCNGFVGQLETVASLVFCTRCVGIVCSKCQAPILDRDIEKGQHECSTETDRTKEPDDFKSLARGKHYQICPKESCGVRLELAEACNFMRCPHCQTGFCFVCGIPVSHNSTHWSSGNPCPRWNQPGGANAQFDALQVPQWQQRLEYEVANFQEEPADLGAIEDWIPGDIAVLAVFWNQAEQAIRVRTLEGREAPRWAVSVRAVAINLTDNLSRWLRLTLAGNLESAIGGAAHRELGDMSDIHRLAMEYWAGLPVAEFEVAAGNRPLLGVVYRRYQATFPIWLREYP